MRELQRLEMMEVNATGQKLFCAEEVENFGTGTIMADVWLVGFVAKCH